MLQRQLIQIHAQKLPLCYLGIEKPNSESVTDVKKITGESFQLVEWLDQNFCLSRVCYPSDNENQFSKPKTTWPDRRAVWFLYLPYLLSHTAFLKCPRNSNILWCSTTVAHHSFVSSFIPAPLSQQRKLDIYTLDSTAQSCYQVKRCAGSPEKWMV